MNPIGYGQQYPMFANCFDRLTTNGILVDDVVGYITGTSSPYLQNYVAQRGGMMPSLPGQILPSAMPPAPAPAPMAVPGFAPTNTPRPVPNGPIYKDIPKDLNENTFVKKDKYSTIKKIATGVLITGLAAFGLYKGFALFKNGGAGFKTAMTNCFKQIKKSCRKVIVGIKWHTRHQSYNIKNSLKNYIQNIGNFFKNLWNQITHRTP